MLFTIIGSRERSITTTLAVIFRATSHGKQCRMDHQENYISPAKQAEDDQISSMPVYSYASINTVELHHDKFFLQILVPSVLS